MSACQSFLVSFTIQKDVLFMHLGHSGHTFIDDVFITTIFSALIGGEVGMAAGTVPVTLNRLGLEVHIHFELFSDASENVLG